MFCKKHKVTYHPYGGCPECLKEKQVRLPAIKHSVISWEGKPIADMSKEELLEAFTTLAKMHKESVELLGELLGF